ncbi:hypothetical protein [Vibrio jasicida]|uniref:hypothetical protein n=1 Tax=Vibrio jasicida TaxID=766224 RepID=UPI004068578F
MYQLRLDDLKYYIPRHDEIRLQDVLWLAGEVHPGSGASGLLTSTINTDVTLYIDERFIKSMTFVGGVLVQDTKASAIAAFVKNVKREFRPSFETDEWLIKGSGEWIHGEIEKKETKMEALTRWILWSRGIEKAKLNFDFHSATILNKKYLFKSKNKRERNVEKFEVVFDSLFSSLKAYKGCNIRVVTDNIEGAQRAAFYNSIEKAKQNYNIAASILVKDDFDSVDSCLMQFVDMNIYPMSRFLMPQNNNILMDFENFALEHVEGTIHKTLEQKGNLYTHFIAAKYKILSELFHVLRHSIRKNQYFQGSKLPESSCHLLSDKVFLNFGANVDAAIHSFCTNPNTAELMDLKKVS